MPDISRRAFFKTAFASAISAMATGEIYAGACLAPPDCNSICPFGGDPKGNGTQECNCYPEKLKMPDPFATSGSYKSLKNIPPRALSLTDGGDAVNAEKFGGKILRYEHNATAKSILVVNSKQFDVTTKEKIATLGIPTIGSKTFTVGNKKYVQLTVTRDEYGLVTGLTADTDNCNCTNCCNCNCTKTYCKNCSNCKNCACSYCSACDCDCCDCGDDSGCFIQTELLTPDGYKAVELLKVGDYLVCENGTYPIVAIVSNTLGSRKAVSMSGHPKTVLTEEHIVKKGGEPLSFDKSAFVRSKEVFTQGEVTGSYFYRGLESVRLAKEGEFVVIPMHRETKTYTPIIAGNGHWGMTSDGVRVLICAKCD